MAFREGKFIDEALPQAWRTKEGLRCYYWNALIAARNVKKPSLAQGGEAHIKRYGPGSGDQDFEAYLFMRENPKGVHFERWRHVYGCGKWFHAARCTQSLEVFGTYAAQL